MTTDVARFATEPDDSEMAIVGNGRTFSAREARRGGGSGRRGTPAHGSAPTTSSGDEVRGVAMRRPRAGEAVLIASLRENPGTVRDGPLGRCTKRGWLRIGGWTADGDPLYEATEAGHRAIATAGGGPLQGGAGAEP